MFNIKLINKIKYASILSSQLLTSVSNFVIIIILVKFVGLKILGQFTFVSIINLTIIVILNNLICTPLLTLTPMYKKEKLRSFLFSNFILFFIFVISSMLILFIFIKFFNFNYLIFDIDNLNIILLYIFLNQIYYYTKKIYYSYGYIIRIFFIDLFIYLVVYTILIYNYFYYEINLTNLLYAFIIPYSFSVFLLIREVLQKYKNNLSIYIYIKRMLSVSIWLTLYSLILWFNLNYWHLRVGILLGDEFLAISKSLMTLCGLIYLIYASLENIIPNKLSSILINNGISELKNFTYKIFLYIFIYCSIISLFLFFYGEHLLKIIFNEEVSSYHNLLLFFLISYIFNFFSIAISWTLRSLEITKIIFFSHILSGFFTILFSEYLLIKFNTTGYLIGIISVNLIPLVVTSIYLFNHFKHNELSK